MKKYLLPPKNAYKANMHCHTNLSDGSLTPEQVKEAYKAAGYSIVAFTDHDVFIPHPELRDEEFLPLNAFEAEFNERGDKKFKFKKTCHLCFVALDEDNDMMPFVHRTKYLFGNAIENFKKVKFDENLPDFQRDFNPECINEAIRIAREKEFYVTYNHPAWSLEHYPDYSKYKGMNAMELYNTASLKEGYNDELNTWIYEEFLNLGNRIACVGGDDNHNRHEFGHNRCDSFGAHTVIMADELEYKTITDALVRGDIYSSNGGPAIKCVYFEDGYIHIECDNAERIVMNTDYRYAAGKIREKGKRLTGASFRIKPHCGYVRFSVYDKYGKCSNTRAYFTDEIFE